jgi:hypothetical protein
MAAYSVLFQFDVVEMGLAVRVQVVSTECRGRCRARRYGKNLRCRIIDVGASPADAGNRAVASDTVSIDLATVNATAIRVHDHADRWLSAAPYGRAQHRCACTVSEHREVEPALCAA